MAPGSKLAASQDPGESIFNNFPQTLLNENDAVDEFTFFFGDDETNLEKMQQLCRACGLSSDEVPKTATLCKEVKFKYMLLHIRGQD